MDLGPHSVSMNTTCYRRMRDNTGTGQCIHYTVAIVEKTSLVYECSGSDYKHSSYIHIHMSLIAGCSSGKDLKLVAPFCIYTCAVVTLHDVKGILGLFRSNYKRKESKSSV